MHQRIDIVSSLAFVGSLVVVTAFKRRRNRREKEHKAIRLVRYLSDQHDWHSYSNDQELFVQEFPKIELHVHLDGSFDPDFLWRYMKDNPESLYCLPVKVDLPWDAKKKLKVRKMVQECSHSSDFHHLCTCRGHRSLQAMLNCFEIFIPLVRRNLDLIEHLAFDFCQRQWEQNTIYTEVRYSPHFLAESFQGSANGVDCKHRDLEVDADKVYQAVTRGLRRGCSKFNITVNQILCALTWRPDWAASTLEMVKKYREDFPCAAVGIDVASGEEHFNKKDFPHLFQPHYDMAIKAKEAGIPLTIHAGESTEHAMDNVRRAIEEYGARRIGHGYRLVQSRRLVEQVRNSNVHVEVCPTSSLETGGWVFEKKDWRAHPCIAMKNAGIRFSLSSDDPAVFHTSLAWQYRIALAKMNFTREDLIQTNLDAIDAAFCSDSKKERLRSIILEYGAYKRLRTTMLIENNNNEISLSEHSVTTVDRRLMWRRAMSEGFSDRVYLSTSQYF